MLDPVRAKSRLIAITAGAFLGGVIIASGLSWTTGSYAATLLQTTPNSAEVRPMAELSEAFIAVAEAVTPAVVNIQTEQLMAIPAHGDIPERFQQYFDLPQMQERREVPQIAGGTGFLISKDGHILTNNHVIEGADKITVMMHDRREFDARVIGRDPRTDVAVIKIEGENFPTVRLGDPHSTRVGEWVLAIGNPLDNLDFTVTAGIVSAKGRPLNIIQRNGGGSYAIESFIQTDAAINPGNSGGPLVNIRGEVIGINSALASETGFYAGYGFAVPIDLASRVAEDLIRYGYARRPIMGVSIAEIYTEDAEVYSLPSISGVLVQSFSMDNAPAERAGLKPGDVIVSVEGEEIERTNELQRVIASMRPGETVHVGVIRYGERLEFDIDLAEAPAPEVATAAPSEPVRPDAKLGIDIAAMTAELAKEYGFTQPGGVVITGVRPYGAAWRKGVNRGLKVVRADRGEISELTQLQQIIESKKPGEIISLTLELNDGTRRIVNIRIPG
ncbi:MAG TPA: trypsin-like peptidase domain-containing protein [Longimicrobiaceae bacterium]|nr:trypsin-like peptidase domain-containing protein [Longimicrobiaceae bacterium]